MISKWNMNKLLKVIKSVNTTQISNIIVEAIVIKSDDMHER